MSSTPTRRHPLADIEITEETALPTEEAFKNQFGGSSVSIAASETKSTIFLKKFFAVAISNVAYLRGIMSEESFSDRFLGDLHLKIIRTGKGSDPVAKTMIERVKGVFDAIERKYLEKVTLWFHEDAEKPQVVKEAYVFSFQYLDEKDCASISLSHDNKPVSAIRTGCDIKEATISFLKELIKLVEQLDPFYSQIFMQMRLSYRENFAPSDYQPRGFAKSAGLIKFPRALASHSVGTVATNHHSVSLLLRAKVREVMIEEVAEEEGNPEELVDEGTKGRDRAKAMLYGLDCSPAPSSQVTADAAPPLDVQCVCGGSEDGVMIVCGVCDTWQHGICYNVFPEQRHRLRGHICLKCVKEERTEAGGRPQRSCLDPSMEKMTPEALRSNALLKRTLLACKLARVKHLSSRRLSQRLGIDDEEALEILDRMNKSKLISSCHCDKKTLKLRKTQSQSQASQSEDGLSQLSCEEEDDQFWDLNREALSSFLEQAKIAAAELQQKRAATNSPAIATKRKTKTPKRKSQSRKSQSGSAQSRSAQSESARKRRKRD